MLKVPARTCVISAHTNMEKHCDSFSNPSDVPRLLLLPENILLKVLQKLSFRCLCCCRLICSSLNAIITKNWALLPRRAIKEVFIHGGFIMQNYNGVISSWECTEENILRFFESCDIHEIAVEETFISKNFARQLFQAIVVGRIFVFRFGIRACRGSDDVLLEFACRNFRYFLCE
ncbi:F-box domain protein [Ancylostoma caninum]|uniref:F-box domain protein n=1 Tax=Ancylostoma caninum TaxID=29170 RepID=A0A368H0J2_ANCCA|nr:F-box domain protein [Ancylostoma caninum]